MPDDPRDDFAIFADTAHMFFGIDEPFAMLRSELENMFCSQIASSRIHSIVARGKPKFLTLGRRREDDENQVIVTHYGVCFQCLVDVETDEHHEPDLWCTVTIAFGDIDRSGEERMQAWMDVHDDADSAFTDEAFEAKFLAFRDEC